MRKVREILRLKHGCGRSQREIAASLQIAVGTVHGYLKRAREAGLSWADAESLSDVEVERRLFRDDQAERNMPIARAPIDFSHVHSELRRKHVTLQLLWAEYQESALARCDGSKPYQYSQFCELYGAWRVRLAPSMRRVHLAGERAFIDYSGGKPRLADPLTGEVRSVELFVMVLGASNYTYAEATLSQSLADFVGSTIRGFEFFGATPEIIVPDQLRSAVSGPDRYEPDINATYLEMAQHYQVAVIPARPAKPKDKAKVENAVLIAQRWVLAKLRNRTFFSLGELNAAIAELVEALNSRPFKKLEGCRTSAFTSIDLPAMKPLPPRRYELAERRTAKVNIDYHVEHDGRVYSVPYALVHRKVEVRATTTTVELFHEGERVASHLRSYGRRGAVVTNEQHRPRNHRDQVWPPERMIAWAATFGPAVGSVVEQVLARYINPEQGYRAALGFVRTAERYGAARMNAACERALSVPVPGGPRRKYIEAILKRGLDRQPRETPPTRAAHVEHENVRGADYYDRKETVH